MVQKCPSMRRPKPPNVRTSPNIGSYPSQAGAMVNWEFHHPLLADWHRMAVVRFNDDRVCLVSGFSSRRQELRFGPSEPVQDYLCWELKA